ncbi:MAG: 16S rRNA (cytidine(1402)-2'-O)-methyltransferase [Clostridia bacterium]|nr:16S rRNA (cytidine(1402)-2'-O)-methyltransferase [Clostridia bacterium]
MAKLFVVATPIGNLNDLTPRMSEALSACDLICAEDTRVTMKLTQFIGIKKPMMSLHRHNEDQKSDGVIERMLAEDLTVCLTCDAGTPGISDPGETLVNAAWEAGIEIIPVSGPSAVVTALSVSGFDSREFAFYGFLPRENKPLKEKLLSILETGIPVSVLYESPHRVVQLVEMIEKTLPGASVCVCCDLTKKFEKILRGGAGEVLNEMRSNPNVEKGEYCIVLDTSLVQKKPKERAELKAEHILLDALLEGLSMREALARASETGKSRNEIYKAKLAIENLFEGEEE